jgi:DNA-binding transcriptional ArsR family regulator
VETGQAWKDSTGLFTTLKTRTMESLVDQKKLKKSITMLGCLVSEKRLLLMQLLLANGETSVGSISSVLRMDQPVVSTNLQLLYDAGYLLRRRKGKFIYYSVKMPQVKLVAEVVERIG